MEDSKLVFSLDGQDEGPIVAFSKDKPQSRESKSSLSFGMDLDLNQGHRSHPPHLPHSPSSPGSLADLSALSEGMYVTSNLVKSSSIELEPRESGSQKGKPLLSLVKSLSTEISRRGEPDVNLSKSDSKLHLHPWKQLNQPKIPEAKPEAGGLTESDGWGSPPSTDSLSPTEPRSSSLIADLEDTRRKFSEAMQDPLSMFSKIIGDESSGSPKQGRGCVAVESPATQGCCGTEDGAADTQLKCRRRNDGELRDVCGLQKASLIKSSFSPDVHTHSRDRDASFDVHSGVGLVAEAGQQQGSSHPRPLAQSGLMIPRASLPLHWLFCVGLLAYGFFVLPLPSYVTGLSLGVACGFVLGLVAVFMFAPQRPSVRSSRDSSSRQALCMDPLDKRLGNAEVLEGWMNETHTYDPEMHHPSVMHSVYATLEGSKLRLEYPSGSIPRWAMFNETPHETTFLLSHTYQLANCKVSLLPPGLAHKRLWNRKYPICITLAEGEVEEESLIAGQEQEEEDGAEERAERCASPRHQLPGTLYLFGRTGREKEEWYQHFLCVSRARARVSLSEGENTDALCGGDGIKESTEDLPGAMKTRTLLDYSAYMTRLIGSETRNPSPSPSHSDNDTPTTHTKIHSEDGGSGGEVRAEPGAEPGQEGPSSAEGQPTWVNSLVGRMLWDFLREKYWTDQVARKIQKKLSKIRLPYFMNELVLADLDMGTCLPQVLSTSKPSLDRRGLWLELELLYTGCLQMTLETKMNLVKLGKEGEDEVHSIPDTQQEGSKPKMCILADSEEESSSAGSSDEEELPPSELQGPLGEKSTSGVADGHTGSSTGRKILRFVDKIAKSKYFQKATENEYIKKKIAEVSNMPLMLSVEVLELSGTLAVNIPPPPTDRIWYSFRVPPKLDLNVRPMLGEREVTFTHVTEWIERKLQCEFQKVFVMPNMDDLYLPLMTSGLESPSAVRHSPAHSTSHQSSLDSQEYLSE